MMTFKVKQMLEAWAKTLELRIAQSEQGFTAEHAQHAKAVQQALSTQVEDLDEKCGEVVSLARALDTSALDSR